MYKLILLIPLIFVLAGCGKTEIKNICPDGFIPVADSIFCELKPESKLKKANFLAKIGDVVDACSKLNGYFSSEYSPTNSDEENFETISCIVGDDNENTIYYFDKDKGWTKYKYYKKF